MGQLDENQVDPIGATPPANQPGHHPEHEQDQPDLDRFAARFGVVAPDEDDQTGGGALASARAVIGRVQDMAAPVGQAVAGRVSQVAGAVDDFRRLSERVERLEREVAELQSSSSN